MIDMGDYGDIAYFLLPDHMRWSLNLVWFFSILIKMTAFRRHAEYKGVAIISTGPKKARKSLPLHSPPIAVLGKKSSSVTYDSITEQSNSLLQKQRGSFKEY